MAGPNNKKRKGAIDLADFDESLLIGSISEMPVPKPADKGSKPAEAAAPEPVPAAIPVAEAAPETPLPEATTNESPEQPVGEGTPAPDTAVEERTAKKEDKKPKPGKPWDYNRFFVPTKGFKKSNIYISESNHQKVKSILTLLGRGVSITDYVENMFAAHWEQYGPEIQKRLSEHNFFKQD